MQNVLLHMESQCSSETLHLFLLTTREIEGVHKNMNHSIDTFLSTVSWKICTFLEKNASLTMLLYTVLDQKPALQTP